MLSNEELTAIKALDLTPDVEQAIVSLEEKHRELLFARGRRTDERRPRETAPDVDRENQTEEDSNTASGSQTSLTKKPELIPWDVQFS